MCMCVCVKVCESTVGVLSALIFLHMKGLHRTSQLGFELGLVQHPFLSSLDVHVFLCLCLLLTVVVCCRRGFFPSSFGLVVFAPRALLSFTLLPRLHPIDHLPLPNSHSPSPPSQ